MQRSLEPRQDPTFPGKQFGNNDVVGEVTLDSGGGTLLLPGAEYDEASRRIVGTCEIKGGTGTFEGASGSDLIIRAGDGTGEFGLDDSLRR